MIEIYLHTDSINVPSGNNIYNYVIQYLQSRFGYTLKYFDGMTLMYDTNVTEIDLKNFNLPFAHRFAINTGVNEFDTDLYQELLDNTETESMLKTYINDGDISGYTDKDLEIMRLIERYNKNVLALRATKKVDVTNTINTSSDSQNIDLSIVNQQLTNINNALHYTNTDDVVKNLTEVVAENDKSVLVENNVVESAPYNPHLKKYDLFEG